MDLSIKTIDQFIAKYPKDTQTIMQKMRQTIHEVVPDATEKMSYGIPTFALNGKNLVHFSTYAKHIGFYPGAIVTQFANELKNYKTSKGTVQFPLDKPVPYDLIQKITLAAIDRNSSKK